MSSYDSPWWDHVMVQVTGPMGLVGTTLTIEELTERVPSYPDGRRARARTVARRMGPILELVERGPNGSRGRGARYRIVAPPTVTQVGMTGATDQEIMTDDEWLELSIRRMTGEKT